MIDVILWDSDGVLVDTEGLYYQANREVLLAELGFELELGAFAETSLRQGRSVFELVDGLEGERREAVRALRNARYEALLAEGVRILDGIEDCLAKLHGRFPMAVVTSSNPEHFHAIHAQTGLLPYFEFALRAGDYVRHKPHPEPYLTAAERLGVAPERCLVVEDTQRGLEAATRAGMRCLAIPHELSRGGDFRSAHAVLASAREVVDAVEGLTGS